MILMTGFKQMKQETLIEPFQALISADPYMFKVYKLVKRTHNDDNLEFSSSEMSDKFEIIANAHLTLIILVKAI